MRKHLQSVGVLNVQRSLMSESKINSKKNFHPFINQRDLGALINGKEKQKKKLSLQSLNFKNWKKIYKRQSIIEEKKYVNVVRNSEQKDLISQRGWSEKKLKYTPQNPISLKNSRVCCFPQPNFSLLKKPKTYSKIDAQLYKKISKYEPKNTENPQIFQLYRHYVETCELNQNIRRQELLKKHH